MTTNSPPQVMMAERTSKFGKLCTAEVIASRTGLTSVEVLESADKLCLGVSKIKIKKGDDVRSIAFRLAYQERRKVNKRSTVKSKLREWKMGECWSGDITPYMHLGHDGYPYATVFVKNTGYMVAYPMKDKTTESVIKCVEKLRVFTATSGEGRTLRELRTDFDPSLSVPGRGDDSFTKKFLVYNASLKQPIQLRRSAPYQGGCQVQVGLM